MDNFYIKSKFDHKKKVRLGFSFLNLATHRGMLKDYSRDCLGIRYRINTLDQTWKWLHQTIALHDYLISITASQSDVINHNL